MADESLKSIVDKALDYVDQKIPLKTLFKKKPKFEISITLALHLSSIDPSKREKIGAFWIDDQNFALKTINLANSVGLKPNSINCGLRQHQIEKIGKLSFEEMKNFVDKRNWKVMKDVKKQFLRSAVEKGGNHHLLKWVKPIKKKTQKQDKDVLEANDGISEFSFINHDFDSSMPDSDDIYYEDISDSTFDISNY